MFTKDRLRDPALLRFQAFVAGEWCDAGSGGSLPVADPATGETLGTVPDCGADETRAAIAAAEAAFPAWRRTAPAERAAILERWNALILENAEDLAAIMTAEQGKPLAEARGEVAYGASFVKWFAEEARRITGDVFTAPVGDRRVLVLKEPVGVCAAITPWNFPIAMITRKVAPAFAAGCPIVVKPADLTPFSALALAVLAERAGVPKGVFSVVTGQAAPIGAEMTGSETVRKLSFTGSTGVGRLLMAQSAPTIKRLSLELGGNAPFIVFDDADLDLAIAGVMASKFRNAGQTCVCANRILVQDGIHDRFVARLAEAAAGLRIGNGFEAGVAIGPLINDAASAKVMAHLDDALSRGARLVAGDPDAVHGRFVPPLVLTGADTGMRLAVEETFGPLAPLMRFSREEDAIAIANATPFGLASYFFTSDIRRAWRVGEALEFGMVGLNTGTVSMEAAPFGGIKQSGLGREGSAYGIDEYLELKSLHMGGL
ncbi:MULTISPECIES: NAD-dependent succinate-semialdehyde dehydrogenase [Methylobacterium]|jgi:succinate-semialdehyde dehydrogenase/glutarate-semialdehyde dehydrogenase|uniref:NAD-dependent succinate-semialdehyde dehydrogenase n=1 Tax=Methylobacterium TaxID=407 RepID=UPI0008F267AA|nr:MULTISPECIES: NAD-dependent succinate-semialdehyde dehydrogenase [Methylobacterium]MBZ6416544.1 NAD-dependent succinate-semialdehyde dehydrogenase [Methylobacterium sp.]MBK3400511.1 NAD-dependent succinate-semialdehyde dehydrogenase [Methylobacterium ajmalii]MBK3409662.1 NAD-dependent succinate-semialdehyde dehydrogenase [Methylobacterium ajmalii]MBK3425692.1 NAD-dependent succinate-semialdehyde dehydrogenase [Methylobacterium ajmalii]SFF42029.1 succinate-semialdehyde dehydrogenase / glutar